MWTCWNLGLPEKRAGFCFSVRIGYRRDTRTQVLSMSLRSMISDNVGEQNGHGRVGY